MGKDRKDDKDIEWERYLKEVKKEKRNEKRRKRERVCMGCQEREKVLKIEREIDRENEKKERKREKARWWVSEIKKERAIEIKTDKLGIK